MRFISLYYNLHIIFENMFQKGKKINTGIQHCVTVTSAELWNMRLTVMLKVERYIL